MTKVHSFFIPDVEYLSDLKGLIKYLGEYNVLFFLMMKPCIIGGIDFVFLTSLGLNDLLICENKKLGACF